MKSLASACLAEFVGTFALCFFGCGSIVLAHDSVGAGSLVTVALAFGFTLLVFVTGTLYTSGGQFNPAVSVALATTGEQPWGRALAFIGVQLIGAASGVGMLTLASQGDEVLGPALEASRHGASFGVFSDGPRANLAVLFLLEGLQTFALMFVIVTTIVDPRAKGPAGLYVAGVVMACIVAFGPLTGSSMNPARSFGPALYGHWEAHWVYWAAPMTGALAAAWVHKLCLSPPLAKTYVD